MDFYKKAIVYDLSNNNTFIQIKINNNIVSCENNLIKSDIENKIKILLKNNKIKLISFIYFFVSLYDYQLLSSSYYWEIIQNLPLKQLPIYRKDNDLYEFIFWYNENFNNNNIEIFETLKFTKRKKYIFDNKEECLNSVEWLQTNPKFDKFLQIFYHAGDSYDLQRYGYLYIRAFFNSTINSNISSSLVNNIFDKHSLKISNYYQINFQSIKDTMFYMMNKMKKGVLVSIKNNKLYVFLPFSKNNYFNDYFTELYIDNNDKELLKKYYKTRDQNTKNKLMNNIKNFFIKHKLSLKNINFDRSKWVGNDCFFRYEDYEGDKSLALFYDFFVKLCQNRKLPDSIFILNIRDHPVLHKDLKDAYVNVTDSDLEDKYKFDKYIPIFSVGASKYTSDIPLITQDDWLRISKKYYPDDCSNSYINHELISVEWKDKINKCVFRGSATGCFIDENNVRIKATFLSKKYPNLLDAGITSFNRKIKKNLNKPLQVIDPQFNKASFMTLQEKAKFKYILNLDGHVSAFRLGHELSLGSVVFIPESVYYLWFSYLLKPYEHYIPIKHDLSDLITKINWCINNDKQCKQISLNSKKFYDKYLTEKGIFDYMQKALSQISFKSLDFKKYDLTIGIIVIYRNTSDNSRLKEKRQYIYLMNKILHNLCYYDIILVEQNYKDKFNIGKLKNIGFDYLVNNKNIKKNKKYDNIIFSDVDMIPDSELLDYYFKTTDSINGLAHKGTRYEQMDKKIGTPFVGGVISCTQKVFYELNGYPNNFYGWEGEDVNLLLRMYDKNKPLYLNKYGRVIDIEEDEQFKNKNVKDKINELNKLNEREDNVYEKNIDYINYKNNGISTLHYNIIQEFHYENNHHIIIDPLKEICMQKYPQLYNFQSKIKNEYNLVKKNLKSIKQIYF